MTPQPPEAPVAPKCRVVGDTKYSNFESFVVRLVLLIYVIALLVIIWRNN